MSTEQRLEPVGIICVECGLIAIEPDEAHGWEAYLTDDEPPEVATYCQSCADREFH